MVPGSKKNSRRWATRGGRRVLLPGERAIEVEGATRAAFAEAVDRAGFPLWPTHDVAFLLDYWPGPGLVRCRLEPVREHPTRGRTGRGRDLQNMPEAILDALEGWAFDNDRQVARVVLERHTPDAAPEGCD